MKNKISIIRHLVGENKLEDACSLLRSTLLEDEGTLLLARYRELSERERRGTISPKESGFGKMLIRDSILKSARELERIEKSKNRKVWTKLFLGYSKKFYNRFRW